MGCLRSMVVRAGCSVMLVVAVLVGFLYHRQILDYADQWRGGRGETFVAPVRGGARSAGDKLERLAQRGGPGYIDLSAGEIAAIIDGAMAQAPRRGYDSVQVALLEGEVRVRGSLDLTGVPRNLLGPLSRVVGEREPVAIGGPLSVDSSGHLFLTVTYLKVRDFPFPKGTIPRILAAAHIPGAQGARVPLPGVPRAGDVRVSPSSVRFYRSSPQ